MKPWMSPGSTDASLIMALGRVNPAGAAALAHLSESNAQITP